ncbi:hypothetical protein [Porphyromonas pogonae]|uniref:hypothetical protein n=1 Tax=Porphyromonas pogonae TaxID=867595 RepID=UPI002E79C09C|nr:hypothetical protein [Porphyromonas pogonae]
MTKRESRKQRSNLPAMQRSRYSIAVAYTLFCIKKQAQMLCSVPVSVFGYRLIYPVF